MDASLKADEIKNAAVHARAGEAGGDHPDGAFLAREIARLADDGYSAEEIGERLQIPRARVIRIARRKGIELAGAGGRRWLRVTVKPNQLALIDACAAVAKVSRGEMLVRLATFTAEEGPEKVRRRLGKLMVPKRAYSPRGTGGQRRRSRAKKVSQDD